MTHRPPLILCSGTLGAAPLAEKFEAAASAGFDGVSVYGHEVRTAIAAGVDCRALVRDAGLMVAEVDGVVVTSRSTEHFDDALDIARRLDARSITMVETRDYDPTSEQQLVEAATIFGELCDRAADQDCLVHIEPFAWSSLNRLNDALAIADLADRGNGGVLLDLWHYVRGPDQGARCDTLEVDRLLGLQLADTAAAAWPDVRDECMTNRLLPGAGHADLAARLSELADLGPLPPVGVEVFGTPTPGRPLADVAKAALDHMQSVFNDASV